MNYHKEIIIKDPPIKYVKKVTKRKKGSKKESLEDVYYLTANLFYSANIHFSLRSRIVHDIKSYLMIYIKDIPKLSKMRLSILYQRKTDNFDLDNKVYFWQKMILDLLKEPTKGDIERSIKYKRQIKSLHVIKDDSCKYVDELKCSYKKGDHLMKIIIEGYIFDQQQQLF